jgi:hypothetical protein
VVGVNRGVELQSGWERTWAQRARSWAGKRSNFSDHDLGLCRITKSDHGFTTANVFRPMKALLVMHPGYLSTRCKADSAKDDITTLFFQHRLSDHTGI